MCNKKQNARSRKKSCGRRLRAETSGERRQGRLNGVINLESEKQRKKEEEAVMPPIQKIFKRITCIYDENRYSSVQRNTVDQCTQIMFRPCQNGFLAKEERSFK